MMNDNRDNNKKRSDEYVLINLRSSPLSSLIHIMMIIID